jgi:hypothetical protein
MNEFDELFDGRKRWGRSHSGTWRIRYSIAAWTGDSDPSRLEAKGEGNDIKATALRVCAVVNPRRLNCFSRLSESSSKSNVGTESAASGYNEIPFENTGNQ